MFVGELWSLLASAQASSDGIPAELVELKKKELQKRKVQSAVDHIVCLLRVQLAVVHYESRVKLENRWSDPSRLLCFL